MIEVLFLDGKDFIYVKCAGHANSPEHKTAEGDMICALASNLMQLLWANTGSPGNWSGPTGGMIELWVDDAKYMESLRLVGKTHTYEMLLIESAHAADLPLRYRDSRSVPWLIVLLKVVVAVLDSIPAAIQRSAAEST